MRVLLGFLLGCLLTGCPFFQGPSVVEYTVVRGDTLTHIAVRHGVSVSDLRQWNGLKSDRIDVGQVLIVGRGVDQSPNVGHPVNKETKKSSSTPVAGKAVAKPCLKGPSMDDLDDDVPDVQTSVGLNPSQIRSAIGETLQGLGKCFSGDWPNAVVDFEFTVGCNGRVDSIRVLDSDGVPEAEVQCMLVDLRGVGFPSHDMQDGMTFRYPVTLSK